MLIEPIKGRKEVDEEIKKYKEQFNYDEGRLCNVIDQEYREIFESEQKTEEKYNFFDNFPFKITFKNKFEDATDKCIFNGKNIYNNLKTFDIYKDDDPISNLTNKILNENYCLNLVLLKKSTYLMENFNLDTCSNYETNLKLSIGHLINLFCAPEYLGKDNLWNCENCKNKVEITKSLSIYYAPRILIICLDKFNKIVNKKNELYIDFNLENFDMGKYITGPDKDNSKYDLFAVIQHIGKKDLGNYKAICKNIDGKWYEYNDSICTSISPNEILSSSAYVLFYRRKTW